jgi:hypothetical protein
MYTICLRVYLIIICEVRFDFSAARLNLAAKENLGWIAGSYGVEYSRG